MAKNGIKTAVVGAIGVATLWQGNGAKADEIYTGATITAPVDISHAHLVYTSNVSVVQTDNATIASTPIRYANYDAGSVPITGLTASTTGTFDLDFKDPAVTLADGEASAGPAHFLTLVGVNSQNQLVIGLNQTGVTWSNLFGSTSYSAVLDAVDRDSDADLAGMVAVPTVGQIMSSFSFGPGFFGPPSTSGAFNFYTYTNESTNTGIMDGLNPVQGTISLPTATPEPGSAAMLAAPVMAWVVGRRRRTV